MIHARTVPFRLLHTSDWHLGRTLHAVPLLADQEVFLAWLIDLLEREPHDALVVAGDVFDRSVPPEDAVAALSRFLVALRSRCPDLPVVVIAGNHDSATRLAFGSDLLASMRLYVRGGAAGIERPVGLTARDGTRAELWAVPFLHAGALTTERAGERFRVTTQVEALEAAIARTSNFDASAAQVLISHCFARGGVVSESERTIVGTASEIDAMAFARFDYVALGHLHRAQRVAARTRYSGSPQKYSFSEALDEKVVLSVDVTHGEEPVVTPIATPIPVPMVVLRGTLEALMEDAAFAAHRESYVRVELTERPGTHEPMVRLRTRFARLLDLRVASAEPVRRAATADELDRRERADVGADFEDFTSLLTGERPDEARLEAFRALARELEARGR